MQAFMRNGKEKHEFLLRVLRRGRTPSRIHSEDTRAKINAEIDRLMAGRIAQIGEHAPR